MKWKVQKLNVSILEKEKNVKFISQNDINVNVFKLSWINITGEIKKQLNIFQPRAIGSWIKPIRL